jgi:putative DNA primase/helicase
VSWDRCLQEWFPNEEVRNYVQRVVGQALVGEQRDHILVIQYGDGANGKGTFVRALGHVLGDYFVVPHKALLVEQKHGVHDTEKAVLFRKRLAVAVESDHRQKLNEAEIKNLTGGDTISARRMREDPWDFVPSHSLWLQTNYLPEIQGRDAGIWRRIRLVEWKQHFDGKQKDDTLDEKLRAETSGILNWLIAGCLAWNAKGLTEPPAVVRSTSQYRRAEDVLARFADDLDFVFQDGVAISSAHLAEAISQWCVDEGIGKAPSANEIASWLKSNGATRDRRRVFGEKNKRTVWDGAGFVNAATPDS